MYNIRTDLAIETREMYRAAKKIDDEIPGVETDIDNSEEDILITKVKITSDVAAEMLNKAKGEYITIEAPKLKNNDEEFNNRISEKLAKMIKEITNLNTDETVLVVGLGNWDITADALGPKVVSHIELTRHLIEYVPQYVKEGTRPICAISPGVLGTTGIETGEIIKGIVEKVSPDILIVIDALASRKMERINTTIQISNTGIVPGSGVGNARNAITQETMGIPVIAIGVPTVVEAAVIANDALELLINKMQMEEGASEALQKLSGEDNYQEIKSALLPKDYNFIVTPKEIDELIENMSNVIAEGINQAL